MSISAQFLPQFLLLNLFPEMIAKKIKKMIINHRELMGYHQNCLRKLFSKLVHHLQNCLTCH